jgi:hypothetical protein
MTSINPNANPLQSQIQAQLQAGRQSSNRNDTARLNNGIRRTDAPVDDQNDDFEVDSVAADRRNRLIARGARRAEDVSSSDEIEEAQERVAAFSNTSLREAPVGRLSAQSSDVRDTPLGQIVDIRV